VLNDAKQQWLHEAASNGYELIPIGSSGEPLLRYKDRVAIETTIAQALRTDAQTFALVCRPDGVIGIDLDVTSKPIVTKMLRWLRNNVGQNIIVRTGTGNKRAVFLRQDGNIGNGYSAMFQDIMGVNHVIEVKAVNATLSIVGPHRKTGVPYKHDPALNVTPLESLPVITREQLVNFMVTFERIASEDMRLVKQGNYGQARENVLESDNPLEALGKIVPPSNKWTEEKISELLATSTCEDRNEWLRVGGILHYYYGGSEEGFNRWHEWSMQFPNYDSEEDCADTWASLGRPVGMAPVEREQIVENVRQQQQQQRNALRFDGGQPVANDDLIDHIEQEVNAEYSGNDEVLARFLSEFVWVAKDGAVARLSNPNDMVSLPNFKVTHAHELIQVDTNEKTGEPIFKKAVDVWVSDRNKMTVYSVIMRPTNEVLYFDKALGLKMLNKYTPPKFEKRAPDPQHVQIFLNHLDYLFGDEGRQGTAWVLNWIAHMIQYPDVRPNTAIFHVSPVTGTGRGWLVEVLSQLVGINNSASVTMSKILDKSGKNGWIGDSIFVSVPEMQAADYKSGEQVEELLKDLVETKRMNVDRKYGAEIVQDVFARMFFQSNNPTALPLRPNNRRFSCYMCAKPKQSQDHYAMLYGLLGNEKEDGFLTSIYNYLLSLNVDKAMVNHPYKSQFEREMVNSNRDPVLDNIERLLSKLDTATNGQWIIPLSLLGVIKGIVTGETRGRPSATFQSKLISVAIDSGHRFAGKRISSGKLGDLNVMDDRTVQGIMKRTENELRKQLNDSKWGGML